MLNTEVGPLVVTSFKLSAADVSNGFSPGRELGSLIQVFVVWFLEFKRYGKLFSASLKEKEMVRARGRIPCLLCGQAREYSFADVHNSAA